MLEHQKKVIEGVSFNKELFEKEIRKSLKWITMSEQAELEIWLNSKFHLKHREVIEQIFNKATA